VLVIIGVGIPWGLSALGVLPAEPFWHGINRVAGLWSGPGFVVWIFWGARWLQQHHLSNRLPIRMLAALGRMSMTGYVLQSVLFTIIMVPWGFAIGAGRGAATVTLIATGIWGITVIFAYLWSRTGRRGPLEILHRTLGYGRPPNAKTQIM
jgi:putative membrane protein